MNCITFKKLKSQSNKVAKISPFCLVGLRKCLEGLRCIGSLKGLRSRSTPRSMDSHDKQCACVAHCQTPSVRQTLDEMEFERGIWSAALDGDTERVRSFLKRSTDPNIRDQAGYTALHYASRAGHRSVCELLLQHGACVNSQTHGGATALHRAAYCGHTDTVRLLLKHGADPGLTDDDGSTALHKAASQARLEVCELLLSSSPVLRTVKDQRSRLPVDLCLNNNVLLELLKPPQ